MEPANFELLVRFQQSAGHVEDWSSALNALVRSFNADHAHVVKLSSGSGRSTFDTFGLDSNLARIFQTQRATDLWAPFEPAIPIGRPALQEEIIPDHLFERSDFYNEIVRPTGGFYSCNYRQRLGSEHHNITLCRKKGQKSFVETERDRLGRLMPHVLTILELHHRLLASQLHAQTLSQALDMSDQCILIFGTRGCIRFASKKAQMLLGDPQEWAAGARVEDTQDNAPPCKLKDVILDCLRAPMPVHRRLILINSKLGQPAALDLMSRPITAFDGETQAVLFIKQIGNAVTFDRPSLAKFFALSPRESEVAEILAQGASVPEIAAQTGIRETTVRFYLKQIFGKVGVSSQAGLVVALYPFRLF